MELSYTGDKYFRFFRIFRLWLSFTETVLADTYRLTITTRSALPATTDSRSQCVDESWTRQLLTKTIEYKSMLLYYYPALLYWCAFYLFIFIILHYLMLLQFYVAPCGPVGPLIYIRPPYPVYKIETFRVLAPLCQTVRDIDRQHGALAPKSWCRRWWRWKEEVRRRRVTRRQAHQTI